MVHLSHLLHTTAQQGVKEMKAMLFSLLINTMIYGTLFCSLDQSKNMSVQPEDVESVLQSIDDTLPMPEPQPEPQPAPINEKAVKVLAKVVCGEVGAHHEDTGRNVLQVIVNRARLKTTSKLSFDESLIREATKKIGSTPQFARFCRADSKRYWQRAIAIEAVQGKWVGSAKWLSASTLWFRTHVGAHYWEKKKGWTKNLTKVGADKYHTFFDGNETAVKLMTKY